MSDAILEKVRLCEQLALENASLRREIELLREATRRTHSDWSRLSDFIVAESPKEQWRLQVAAQQSKGVEALLKYLSSLWNENAELKQASTK